MILEINKLIESENKSISKIGWILYGQDQEGFLNKNELDKVLELLCNIESEFEVLLENEKNAAYEEGFEEAKSIYEVDC